MNEVAYQFWNCSEGTDSKQGRWASGPAPDGLGEFEYVAKPKPLGEQVEEADAVDPRVHGTPKKHLDPVPS